MKKQILFLSIVMFGVLNAFAQTPYDNFAPEQSAKSMIELPKMQFKIANTDLNSKIRYIEFDNSTLSLNLLNDNDSVIGTLVLSPNDKKFLTMDRLAEKYPSISQYAYCMNNPVNYIDPDGRDAMLAGRGTKDDPYVITATYYYQNGSLDNAQVKGLNDAVAAYNNSGKNGVTEIKNSDGSKSYVSYNLSAQGVENVNDARLATAFETTSGDTRYYGNIVGTEPSTGNEFGSANNFRVDFNVGNINAGVADGMNSSSLNKGVAIHEIGHNLGGEHNDGTSVMNMITTTTTHNQLGGTTTVSHSYPSMSTKFTPIIFNRRDTPFSTTGNIWTKKP